MCDCHNHADLVMVHGDLKVYRCTECEREWEEIKPYTRKYENLKL